MTNNWDAATRLGAVAPRLVARLGVSAVATFERHCGMDVATDQRTLRSRSERRPEVTPLGRRGRARAGGPNGPAKRRRCAGADENGECVLQVFGDGGESVKLGYNTEVPHWANESRILWWN
jgi:hypothetical protein